MEGKDTGRGILATLQHRKEKQRQESPVEKDKPHREWAAQAAGYQGCSHDGGHSPSQYQEGSDSVERVPCWWLGALRTDTLHAWFTDTLVTLADWLSGPFLSLGFFGRGSQVWVWNGRAFKFVVFFFNSEWDTLKSYGPMAGCRGPPVHPLSQP